jgi:hypothetical protein
MFARIATIGLRIALIAIMSMNHLNLPLAATGSEEELLAWVRLNNASEQAYGALVAEQKGNPDKKPERVRLYSVASAKMEEYRQKYGRAYAGLTWLRLTYQLGAYYELSEQIAKAKETYLACLKHPLIHDKHDKTATYDGTPIEELAGDRLKDLQNAPGGTITSRIIIKSYPDGRDPYWLDTDLRSLYNRLGGGNGIESSWTNFLRILPAKMSSEDFSREARTTLLAARYKL